MDYCRFESFKTVYEPVWTGAVGWRQTKNIAVKGRQKKNCLSQEIISINISDNNFPCVFHLLSKNHIMKLVEYNLEVKPKKFPSRMSSGAEASSESLS